MIFLKQKESNPNISGYSSIFLDSLRLLAALVVVYVHAHDQWIQATDTSLGIRHLGHTSVIVFFVLSGFVIAFTTQNKNRGWKQYLQARLSRLYSMLLPALLISAIIEFTIFYIDFNMLSEYTRGASWPRYLFTMLFLNESGLISAAPPINRPLWSLSYEFWYYIIFSLFFFLEKGWRTYLIIVIFCCFAGPKILIMMPIWLAGTYAYNHHREFNNSIIAWFLVFTSIFFSVILSFTLPIIPFELGQEPMFYSNQFLTDYAIGIIIAAGLLILPMNRPSSLASKFVPIFRKLGDLTFPIYVLHHPFLILWRTLFGYQVNDKFEMWTAIISVLFITSFLGVYLEGKRYLFTNFFKWLLNLRFLNNWNTKYSFVMLKQQVQKK
tara:strand:+ start:4473 stop:5615 length:1143 start_codon:yes stop_codon:yes gene_type:complete